MQRLAVLAAVACVAGASRLLGPASLRADGLQAGPSKLRICNAYDGDPLDIRQAQAASSGAPRRLTEAPLAFKACRDFDAQLESRDQIRFASGGASVGAFTATRVPTDAAVLLLIVSRRDENSRTAVFQSHSFARVKATQIAVIDAYHGPSKSFVQITDARGEKKGPQSLMQRAENLRYNSVIAVTPGPYIVSLVGVDGAKNEAGLLTARGTDDYVMMRVGRGSDEELVLYGSAAGQAARPLQALALLALGLLAAVPTTGL